jgi:hypothetical protein
MHVISRENIPGKLSLQAYLRLPAGSEVILHNAPPLEFLDKDVLFVTAREKGFVLRKVNSHPIREFFKKESA